MNPGRDPPRRLLRIPLDNKISFISLVTQIFVNPLQGFVFQYFAYFYPMGTFRNNSRIYNAVFLKNLVEVLLL